MLSFPGFTVDVDKPTVLLDDAKHGCQAQPRALANLLGSEKWLEERSTVAASIPIPVSDTESNTYVPGCTNV